MADRTLPFPFDTRELRLAGELHQPAYTYALIHLPSGRVHLGASDDIRKAANMWAKRLRDPDGNPQVPRPFMAFPWAPEDWAFKLGSPHPTLSEARSAVAKACLSPTLSVLNSTRHLPVPSTVCKLPRRITTLVYPNPLPREQHELGWRELLPWLLAFNRSPHPSDAQVRELWIEYHERQGVQPPTVVYDPDRQVRRERQERTRRYSRNAREVRAGLRPRTWLKLR